MAKETMEAFRMYDSTTVNVEGLKVRLTALGSLGEVGLGSGKIESDYTREQAVELAKKLVSGYLEDIPKEAEQLTMCGDGRDWDEFADGSPMLNAYPREMGADGTAVDQLIIADAPTIADIPQNLSLQEQEVKILERAGLQPCGHIGCGYQCERAVILETVATKKEAIGRFASKIPPLAGLNVRKYMDENEQPAMRHAQALRAQGWDGNAYIAEKAEKYGDSIARLKGKHLEKIGLILNTPGKSINTRKALADGLPQAFVANADRMIQRAHEHANNAEDQKRLLVAGVALPVAAGDTLAGPGMPFIYAEVIE